MTDLEITRLCAEAMELPLGSEWDQEGKVMIGGYDGLPPNYYEPLTDDAQCMALGKSDPVLFAVVVREWAHEHLAGRENDLNRMVCTEFAEKQARKK